MSENKAVYVGCPCCTHGQHVDTQVQKCIPVCPHCRNTGLVRIDIFCVCGEPVHVKKDKIWYCGREICLTEAKSLKASKVSDSEWDEYASSFCPC